MCDQNPQIKARRASWIIHGPAQSGAEFGSLGEPSPREETSAFCVQSFLQPVHGQVFLNVVLTLDDFVI